MSGVVYSGRRSRRRSLDVNDRAPRGRELPVREGSHPDNCRLVRKLAGGSVGELAGSEHCDEGSLRLLSDPMGRNKSEARAGLESSNADADRPVIWGRPHVQSTRAPTRFYYNICREDILVHAYRLARASRERAAKRPQLRAAVAG